MLNRKELKDIAGMGGNGSYYASLYLNVNPLTNPKGDYIIQFKNMLKNTIESLDRAVFKKVEKDLKDMDAFVLGNKRSFKKALTILSSSANSFWREYQISLPVKNELIVDKTPHIKPLLDMLDNYQRYAVLFVDKEAARVFVIHLGEIQEYGEVHTPDVPGKHKKGGWFALSQNHYERHVDYHVGLHLKDVVKKIESFFKGEYIGRLIIGGSDEAVSMTKELLPRTVTDKLIGTFHAGMFEGNADILKKVEPVLQAFEKKRGEKTVSELITRAMKNDRAALGLEDVLRVIREGRVMKLVFEGDFKGQGFQCTGCSALSAKAEAGCPYCGGRMEDVNYIVDLAAQKAVEQGALVEVVSKNEELQKTGSIGAFLRF